MATYERFAIASPDEEEKSIFDRVWSFGASLMTPSAVPTKIASQGQSNIPSAPALTSLDSPDSKLKKDPPKHTRVPSTPSRSSSLLRTPSRLDQRPAIPSIDRAVPVVDTVPAWESLTNDEKENIVALKLRRKEGKEVPQGFWMSDNAQTACKTCNKPFTLFLRRHHCRLCGHIFCSNCASATVRASWVGNTDDLALVEISSPVFWKDLQIGTKGLIVLILRDYTQATVDNEELLSSLHNNLIHAPVLPPISSPPPPPPLPLVDLSTLYLMPKVTDEVSTPKLSSRVAPSVHQTPSPSSPSSPGTTSPTIEPIRASSTPHEESFRSPLPRLKSHIRTKSGSSRTLRMEDVLIGSPASKRLNFTTAIQSQLPGINEDLKEELPVAVAHRRTLELLTYYLLSLEGLSADWKETAIRLARAAAVTVVPRLENQKDSADIRTWVKIKGIPNGRKRDSRYIAGLVFDKNRAFKTMRSQLTNPKVLLIGTPLHFCASNFTNTTQASTGKWHWTAFDDLLTRENDYVSHVVDAIIACRPDIVFVQSPVARTIQEQLNKLGIVLFVNVKPAVMKTLSRICRTTIHNTMPLATEASLGSCGRFQVDTFPLTVSMNIDDNEFIEDDIKSYAFIEDCPPHLYMTLLVRGFRDIHEFLKLKRVIRQLVYVSYQLHLEESMLSVYSVLPINLPDSISPFLLSPNLLFLNLSPALSSTPYPSRTSSQLRLTCRPVLSTPPQVPHLVVTSEVPHGAINTAEGDVLNVNYLGLKFDYRSVLNNPTNAHSAAAASPNFTLSSLRTQERFVYLHSLYCSSNHSLCIPYELHLIDFFSSNDISLGQFLLWFCFDPAFTCSSVRCGKDMLEHERSFLHHGGRLNVTVKEWDAGQDHPLGFGEDGDEVAAWAQCHQSTEIPSPQIIDDSTLRLSFGKFLELHFYGLELTCAKCKGALFRKHIHYYFYRDKIAIFEFESIKSYSISLPSFVLPAAPQFHQAAVTVELSAVQSLAVQLYSDIMARLHSLIDLAESRETLKDSGSERLTRLNAELNHLEAMSMAEYDEWRRRIHSLVEVELHTNEDLFGLLKQLKSLKRDVIDLSLHWNDTLRRVASLVSDLLIEESHDDKKFRRPDATSGSVPALSISHPISTTTSNVNPLSLSMPLNGLSSAFLQPSTPNNTNRRNDEGSDDNSTAPSPSSSMSLGISASASALALTLPTTLQASGNIPSSSPSPGNHSYSDKRRAEVVPQRINEPPLVQLLNLDPGTIYLLPLGKDNIYFPVRPSEPSTLFAYALNMPKYFSDLQIHHTRALADERVQERSGRAASYLLYRENTSITTVLQHETEFDGKFNFSCTIPYAYQFSQLRALCRLTEDEYTLSLSTALNFQAVGGKSMATFMRTGDERFIIKTISPTEEESFNDFASHYFDYMHKIFQSQVPSALAKIVGMYTTECSYKGEKKSRKTYIVMENLFFNRRIAQTFDLKGSQRSRRANDHLKSNNVLLDENLLDLLFEQPLCIDQESKSFLGMATWNDSLFLSTMNVMDYSLLVGLDEDTGELVCGVIDYLRKYTWDKQLESWVKRSGMVVGGKVPTIISPKQYKRRFRYAIWMYFAMVPRRDIKCVVEYQEEPTRAKESQSDTLGSMV